METKIVSFDFEKSIKSLLDEQVIAIPTETVYGLACISSSKKAYDLLVKIKQRPNNKPFTLMGGTHFDFSKYAYIDENINRIIKKFIPGPITLLLKPKENLPYQITLNTSKIGIRISSNKSLANFIDKVGTPLLVPSANISGTPPLVTAKDVFLQFNGQIPFIINEKIKSTKPSTIVDLSIPNKISLIRQGELNFLEIKNVFERK